MHPNSSQMKRPANASTSPKPHSSRAAPTLPTLSVMEDGVEKIPVPMILPML